MKIFNGLINGLGSKKFWMCLIILIVTAIVTCYLKDLPASFAAVVGSIATIYMWTTAKTDIELNKNK